MPAPISAPPADAKRVLVTGAAGRIGQAFAEYAASRYRLRLMTLPADPNAHLVRPYGECVEADISDRDSLAGAFKDIDACLHLAGDPGPNSTWDSLLANNITGTYNVLVAALAAKCSRVVFASSIHAISGYSADVQVKPNEPVNPGDVYGVSKCFGEALGRYMAEQEGMSFIAIRIGAYQPDLKIKTDSGVRLMDAWVSPRDLNQLFCRSIDADNLKFAIFHGLSDNRFKRMDISNARELIGYAPEDDSAVTNELLQTLRLPEQAMAHSLSDSENPQASSGLRDQLPKP
ncbi:MAG: NAD-dependent epimerase/dehydratase [Phycisphaerales bacterium]|nr:NAD-dependent epimerase/dehydratase [Phycisphaerales bacterium]